MTQATLVLFLSTDGQLTARVPASREGAHESTFTVPSGAQGMATLRRVLEARQRAERNGTQALVGTDGSPTVGMIEEWLRANQVTVVPASGGAKTGLGASSNPDELGL